MTTDREKHVPVPSAVEDIRGRENEFTLDKQGFTVVNSETREKTFDDEERIKDIYYEDCEKLLKEKSVEPDSRLSALIARAGLERLAS